MGKFTKVKCVELVEEEQDVYDIEVENTHCFFANGMLAHNCIAGVPARKIFDHQIEPDWEKWGPNQHKFEEIQKELKETIDAFKWALGDENYYLEIQFNKLTCVGGSTLIETNKGKLQIKEVIERMDEGENDFVVKSFNEKTEQVEDKKIVWGALTRKSAKVIKINLKNGKSIVVTPDHKVFTDKGWMEAGQLKNHKDIRILFLK